MTKDVLITISGIQTIDGEVNDPIETVTPGEYYFRNGKHYILYDEVQEGVPGCDQMYDQDRRRCGRSLQKGKCRGTYEFSER